MMNDERGMMNGAVFIGVSQSAQDANSSQPWAQPSRNPKVQTRNTRKKSTKKHEKDFCRREAEFGREAENISELKN
ncbi:hypothetical protein LLG95_06180 [bacterium]|nr:hypothetical protein [bacterium]